MVLPVAMLVFGGVVVHRSRRVEAFDPIRPLLALRVAYLPNALLCIYSFIGDRSDVDIRLYLALVTTAVYLLSVCRIGFSAGVLRAGTVGPR